MDIVDTFNHLIPSDQLDDSLLIGQNLECEASNEFGTGLLLEDSLKNMLSDKDPMFGSASSQFNPLDNDDSNFLVAGSTGLNVATTRGLSGELTSAQTTPVKRPVGRPRKYPRLSPCETIGEASSGTPASTKPRGRPGRKPTNRQLSSFLIEKGVRGSQLKKELAQGGRVNINDIDAGLWLNPVVVLRRLTVTVGGFRIELLPGPSYDTGNADVDQSVSFGDAFTYSGDVAYAMLPDDKVKTQDPTPENPGGSDVGEGCGAEDVPLGLGPYVNPNDVQAANKSPAPNSCSEKTIVDDESISEKEKPAAKGKDAIKEPQNLKNDKCGSTNKIKIDSQEKQKITPKALPKSKQGLPTVKDKSLVSFRPNSLIKGLKTLQNAPSKLSQKEDVHHAKSLKEKKGTEALKRPGEKTQPEHASKVQKIQTGKPVSPKPKLPGPSSSVVKKTLSSDGHTEQQDLPKHPPSHNPKPEQAPPALGSPGHSSKTPEDGGQEKPKGKKTDKFLQKQKSKNARSISVEEPQLFVPDNAPAAKKESADERPANSETVWDGSNSCGLCKKHHNNVFMVGCGRCDEWFHGDCVGLDLAKVREMEDEDQMYVCLKCCAEESTKVEPDTQSAAKPEGQANLEVLDNKAPAKQRQGPTQALTSGGVRPMKKESDRRQSTEVKDPVHKTGVHPKQETRSKGSSAAPKKPASVDEIRRSVRDSLKEILLQRLKESDLKVPTERASEVAKKTERELFHLYKDTDSKYKSKYRSLMFNLKDSKNNVLFRRVLKGDISPGNLIRMSPEELASKELAAWRQRENRHTIEMIEKEQREAERRPITKITHKGEIEIESEEPVKAAETVEDPPALKVPEVPDELIPLEKNPDSVKIEKDTTALHKSHLFDLHCKICTGRMAPPVEEATTKVVKVATTVVRRQSAATEETKSVAPPRKEEDLHLAVLEESLRSATSSRHEGRSTFAAGKEDSVAFLNNLTSMWRGFVNMPAVAKLVIKAFPVSGVLDNLTEDLPDSIQVGGRISPQTVWDYFEKIRATGTKEVCLIRFSPETEEDAISYTLLYAYFSSRKRFGVVSNNLKRVKDMYIIPLGATEKVPHQLVPFDGPGLENNRSNLLLGLIIRQRPKRDFLPVDVNETAAIIPEAKPLTLSTNSARATEEEEKLYLSSLTPAKTTKETDKLISAVKEEDEPILESVEEESVIEDGQGPESNKPLRFLPGVLVGWGGELPPLPDFGAKGTPAPDDSPKTKADSTAPGSSAKSPTAVLPRMDRFVIKKKEPKPGNVAAGPPDASAAQNTSGKDVAKEATWQGGGISLKDKPPDVSTEAFLARLSASPSGKEATAAVSGKKEDAGVLTETEKGITKGTLSSPSKSQAEADHAKSTKLPLSGILKKSCVYSPVGEAQASQPASLSPQPVPMFSSAQNHVTSAPPLQGLQLPHAMDEPGIVIPGIGCSPSREDPIASQASAMATDATCPPPVQRPQAAGEAPELAATGAATVLAPPQEPGKYGDSSGHPLEEVQTPPVQQQNNSAPRAAYNSPVTSHVPPELPIQHLNSSSESPGRPPPSMKDYKRPEDRYNDPWERPRHTEEREHYGRHGYQGEKSRHHERERKHERGYEDKYRERSRHSGHEDRHGERKKARHHSEDYGNRYKERHRHRRDSDHENSRRSSKDSYS